MRLLITILFFFLMSCSSKYSGLHNNTNKFREDIAYCLEKSCYKHNITKVNGLSLISSLYAYGGGGVSANSSSNKISYKTFNFCMKNKGYYKDDKGIFEIPVLTCDKS